MREVSEGRSVPRASIGSYKDSIRIYRDSIGIYRDSIGISGPLLSQISLLTKITEVLHHFGLPHSTPPNETGGEAKLSWEDFTMGGIGGGGKNLRGLTTLA